MKLEDWKKDESLVTWAQDLFASANWKILMAVMAEEHPKNYEKPPEMSADRELGVIYGYDRFENNLNSATKAVPVSEMPQPTFEPSEPSQEKED